MVKIDKGVDIIDDTHPLFMPIGNKNILDAVLEVIPSLFEIDEDEIISKAKAQPHRVRTARSLCVYLLRHKTTYTLLDLAKIFNRDHSTIIYLNETVKDHMSVYPNERREIEDISNLVDMIIKLKYHKMEIKNISRQILNENNSNHISRFGQRIADYVHEIIG